MRRLLLYAAAHLYHAVVAEKTPYLAGYLRHGVGGEFCAEALIIAVDGLEKADTAELIEILRVDAASEKPPRHAPDKAGVFLHQSPGNVSVAALRRAYGRDQLLAHLTLTLVRIQRCMVTVVPFPGVERTRSLSMKLPMMVKPMPLRSSPPVV